MKLCGIARDHYKVGTTPLAARAPVLLQEPRGIWYKRRPALDRRLPGTSHGASFMSSIFRRFMGARPHTGSVQSSILPFGLALFNELRQYNTGQKMESPAVSCCNILLADKGIETCLAAV